MSVPSTERATEAGMADEGRPATPRWVKWSGAALATLLAAFVGMALLGENHEPGRHLGHDTTTVEESAP